MAKKPTTKKQADKRRRVLSKEQGKIRAVKKKNVATKKTPSGYKTTPIRVTNTKRKTVEARKQTAADKALRKLENTHKKKSRSKKIVDKSQRSATTTKRIQQTKNIAKFLVSEKKRNPDVKKRKRLRATTRTTQVNDRNKQTKNEIKAGRDALNRVKQITKPKKKATPTKEMVSKFFTQVNDRNKQTKNEIKAGRDALNRVKQITKPKKKATPTRHIKKRKKVIKKIADPSERGAFQRHLKLVEEKKRRNPKPKTKVPARSLSGLKKVARFSRGGLGGIAAGIGTALLPEIEKASKKNNARIAAGKKRRARIGKKIRAKKKLK